MQDWCMWASLPTAPARVAPTPTEGFVSVTKMPRIARHFFRSTQDREIAAHGGRESVVQRFADQRMADRNFRELRNGAMERTEVLLVEVVSRIHRQSCRGRVSGSACATSQFRVGVRSEERRVGKEGRCRRSLVA